jgi:hypothetical protein
MEARSAACLTESPSADLASKLVRKRLARDREGLTEIA